eukprot:XP_017950856.1 PREDICTED: methylated-DNA--protein-cysteine methyltransferase isoform X2 [Xenopus tropicalis]
MNYKAPVASPFPGRTPSSHSHERDPPPFHSRAPRDQEGAQGAELARKLLATRGKSLVQQENLVSRPLQKMAVKNISCKMEEALISCALGKIQISACEKGIHEIKLQEDAVPESRTKGASVSFEIVEGPREMIEPLKQCTAWLRAYFCEPRLTEKLPVPAFHHPTFAKVPIWIVIEAEQRISLAFDCCLSWNKLTWNHEVADAVQNSVCGVCLGWVCKL